jgi:L-amino acid N-acyltransferase YncA
MRAPRLATEADLPGIFAIYDEEVLHGIATCDTQPRSEAERLDWLRAHPAGQPALVIDDEDGGIAAWGCLSAWSPRPAYARTCEDTVYVRADRQGRGLGGTMLRELVGRAKELRRALVIARVVEGNPASRRLHEACGFETIGVMSECAEKLGRLLDVRIMGRRIG